MKLDLLEELKKFKPCPFCGDAPDVCPISKTEEGFIARCPNLKCVYISGYEETLEALIKKWNTRTGEK